jgi:L-cystine transport system permease protein
MDLDLDFMYETFFKILGGISTTLELTILSLLLAAPIAFYMAVLRLNDAKISSGAIRVYVSFVRGTPIILQILLLYSLLPSVLNTIVQTLGIDFNVFDAIDPFFYAVMVFSLNTTALLSEVFRSALISISKGQLEAGLSIGLTRFQVYIHVIIPQAMVVALPNICNITVNLIKGTSLAFLMTVKDVLAIGKIAASFGYNYIEAYIDVFFVYIILCTIIQVLYTAAESKISTFRAMHV